MLPRIVLLLALISAAHAQTPGYKYSWVPNPLGGFPEWKQVPVDPPATAGITLKSTDPLNKQQTTIGTASTININPGRGVVLFMSTDGQQLSLQFEIDTAIFPTYGAAQSSGYLNCISPSGPAYACSMMPTLERYTTGMVVHWRPGAIAPGSLTLNIDTLGAKPIKGVDGVSDATGLAAGQMYELWYDGAAFRMLSAPSGGPVVPLSQVLPPAGPNGVVLTSKGGVWVPSTPSGIPFFGPAFQPPPVIAIPQSDGTWLCGSKPILDSYPGLTINPWSIVAVVDRLEQHAWSDPAVDDWSYPPPLNKDGLAVLRPTLNASAWKPKSVVVCHYALQ